MKNLDEIIEKMRTDWSVARKAKHFGQECPFLLKSCFSKGMTGHVKIEGIPDSAHELIQFWKISERADLFKDGEYGQWGIKIFSPQESAAETERQKNIRNQEFVNGDIIFASFYGDSDLLLIDSEGDIYVVLPLDDRCDWPKVATSLKSFLENLMNAEGAKYWELPKGSQ
jgi:hypothetical protein